MTVKQWPAVLENISVITEYVNVELISFGVNPAKCINAMIAVEEIAVNIIKHGYRGNPGNIDLYVEKLPSKIAIHILDTAPFFNVLNATKPDIEAGLNERQIGGLGIMMVKKMMDEVLYEREGNSNHVTLIVNC